MPNKVFECTITVIIAFSPFLSDYENTIKINNDNNTIIFESTKHAIDNGNTSEFVLAEDPRCRIMFDLWKPEAYPIKYMTGF